MGSCRLLGRLIILSLILLLTMTAESVWAQSDIAGLLDTWQNGNHIDLAGEAVIQAANHDKFSNTIRLDSYESQGRVELIHSQPINPTLGYRAFYLDINAPVTSGLPRRLSDTSIGFATPIAKFGDWFTAISLGVGYAGDAPFSQSNAYYSMGTLLVGRKFTSQDSLLIALDYNGNRAAFQDIPLPGFGYSHRVNDELSVVAGFPFSSVTYEPRGTHLRAKFDFSFPATVAIDVTYPLTKQIGAYANLRNIFTGFHTALLPSNRRIFFEQRRAELGLKWRPTQDVDIALGGGYAFDTHFERGFDGRDTVNIDRQSDGVYFRVDLEFRH